MLSYLHVQNFRNIKEVELRFENNSNIFIGENAQGKSSLLESIYLLSRNQIQRGTLRDLFQYEKPYSRIEGVLNSGEDIAIVLSKETGRSSRKYFEKGTARPFSKKRIPLTSVLFHPDDLRILTGSPARRRKMIDEMISGYDGAYRRNLSKYEKTLKNRNTLLVSYREEKHWDHDLYTIITSEFIHLATQIWKGRERWKKLFFAEFNHLISELWSGNFCPKIRILSEQTKDFPSQVEYVLEREKVLGRTLLGPHRDDFDIIMNNKSRFAFDASRGELRTLSMAMKLSELNVYETHFKTKPLILLDDIMSELDKDHRHRIERISRDYQSFITATEDFFFSKSFFVDSKRFHVKSGEVQEEDL